MSDSQTEQLGYAEALTELDSILAELESADVDVDALAHQVSRAAALIALCRGRISKARLSIDDVVADLDAVTQAHELDKSE